MEAPPDFGPAQTLNDSQLEDEVTAERVSSLPRSVRHLSTGVLHLGVKSKLLREAGLVTIGQIADAWPIEYGDIKGLGRAKLDLLVFRFHTLVLSVTADGAVNWDKYCEECGIPLVPSSSASVTGSEFLDTLGQTLAEIADSLPDKDYAKILRSRLSRMPGEQKTLDEIARTSKPRISRERVRQKEKKLLRQLPGGLIWENYDGLNIHFRPEFAEWWCIAASRFGDADEIEIDKFVTELANAWDVDVSSVMRQLPIILAVVTGEPGMPAGFRSLVGLDPVYYGNLSCYVRQLPLFRLRLNHHAARLDSEGIHTLGDLVELYRSGSIAQRQSASARCAAEHLNGIAGCLDSEGQINWSSYRMTLGLEQLPCSTTTSAENFATELPGVMTELLERCQITARSVHIFIFRTSHEKEKRPTLAKTGEHLDTFGPGIKREETYFLQRLNDMIVGRDYSLLPVWLNESWLRYWREAEATYSSSGSDFGFFQKMLLARWRLRKANRAIAVLWSVLSGYPNGRPVRTARPSKGTPEDVTVGRIRLKGFRRVH